jgi:hypothetical protein
MSDERKRWLDEPRNLDRLFYGLVALCALLAVSDLGGGRDAFATWEGLPNFHGFFGFVAFWCIVIAGKHLRKLLWRPEDYYDE